MWLLYVVVLNFYEYFIAEDSNGECHDELKVVALAAHKFVLDMISNIKSGELTLQEFQQVVNNEDRMNKLILSVSGDLNLEIYHNRLKNLIDHENHIRLLLDLLPKTYEGMCIQAYQLRVVHIISEIVSVCNFDHSV